MQQEHPGDILLLIEHFLEEVCRQEALPQEARSGLRVENNWGNNNKQAAEMLRLKRTTLAVKLMSLELAS